ncbi:MAG TPA: ABC transporter ATP-binding protein [Stellaceae bacterium]|nr:ABC transporter ATP-binding protein [Stellaceae bacterium]
MRAREAIAGRDAAIEPRAAGASVEFVGVTKKYGALSAVDALSLAIEPGEFLTLLGPSGSGKSTVLMLLAGFVAPNAGEIRVDGRNLLRVPANRRNQGVVFQNYALFPHMTVRENLAYPLAARGITGRERDALIARTVERVRMPELLDRYPHQLSGGQQQRVALARAIVFQPPLLLMDESLSALDRNLREEMQYELKGLHRQLRTTIIFVTHDQDEALTMSDRVAVLQAGRLAQLGRPREIYKRPVNSFVARFLGDTNFIEATVLGSAGGLVEIETAAGARLLASASDAPSRGRKLRAMVRPEALELVPRSPSIAPVGADATRRLAGRIARDVFVGNFHRYWIRSGDLELHAKVPNSARYPAFKSGDEVEIVIHAKDLLVMQD